MAEEFQAAVCGENWWNINSTRSVFPLMMNSSSTCSVAAADAGNYSTWPTDFFDLKGTKSFSEETNNLVSDSSLGFLDAEKPQQHSDYNFGMSSSTSSNWNQSLLRQENSFHSALQEETDIGGGGSTNSQIQVSTVDAFKAMNQEFSLDQQSNLNSVTNSELCGGFSASYGYPSTILIQGLYDPKPQPQPQPQNSLFTNPSLSYSSTTNYGACSNELSPTWSKVSPLLKASSVPKQQLSGLHFSNNTPFWNASSEALHDIGAGVFASSQAQYQMPKFEEKLNSPNTQSNKLKREESPDATSATKKNSSEPAIKRPRIETPSPLPTFKVRKEKLGDRITALQQLVSPFGKTDTASVLHEAIEYIKFLHDQVSVLSTPYLKNGAPIQQQQGYENVKEAEGGKQDLRSRGLCLVPISSTLFPVANETTVDFWTPTFGGALMLAGRES